MENATQEGEETRAQKKESLQGSEDIQRTSCHRSEDIELWVHIFGEFELTLEFREEWDTMHKDLCKGHLDTWSKAGRVIRIRAVPKSPRASCYILYETAAQAQLGTNMLHSCHGPHFNEDFDMLTFARLCLRSEVPDEAETVYENSLVMEGTEEVTKKRRMKNST